MQTTNAVNLNPPVPDDVSAHRDVAFKTVGDKKARSVHPGRVSRWTSTFRRWS